MSQSPLGPLRSFLPLSRFRAQVRGSTYAPVVIWFPLYQQPSGLSFSLVYYYAFAALIFENLFRFLFFLVESTLSHFLSTSEFITLFISLVSLLYIRLFCPFTALRGRIRENPEIDTKFEAEKNVRVHSAGILQQNFKGLLFLTQYFWLKIVLRKNYKSAISQ